MSLNLQEWFGGIDIYLFDQLLKGRIVPGMRVLDAGCGGGRNLVYLLRSGFEVCGVDESSEAIAQVRRMAREEKADGRSRRQEEEGSRQKAESRKRQEGEGSDERFQTKRSVAADKHAGGMGSQVAEEEADGASTRQEVQSNFRVEAVEKMSWGDESFEVVLSSAVLHFARSEEQWRAMMNEMWRVLMPGGIFFARLASTIGIESQVHLIEGRRYRLPDGSDRFLVDEAMLLEVMAALNGEWLDPIKTTVVQNMRSMTTICLKKGPGSLVFGL
ncbi:MAG: SAM-dependent methyltransferase [Acidobacteria bacterium]|nr:SAM-dependent methyltransferase [Acidobacteriota bacterium]